jgi:hypothetical protein
MIVGLTAVVHATRRRGVVRHSHSRRTKSRSTAPLLKTRRTSACRASRGSAAHCALQRCCDDHAQSASFCIQY